MGKSIKNKQREALQKTKQYDKILEEKKYSKIHKKDCGTIHLTYSNFFRLVQDVLYCYKFKRYEFSDLCKIDSEKTAYAFLQKHILKYKVPTFLSKYIISNRDWKHSYGTIFGIITSGQSLYKSYFKFHGLTKQMAFWFLKAPESLTPEQAVWWSIIRGFGGDVSIASTLTRSTLIKTSDYFSSTLESHHNQIFKLSHNVLFKLSIIKFFIKYQTNLKEIDELCDYLLYTYNQNNDFSLKGRTLDSVRKLSEQWHKDIAKYRDLGNSEWPRFLGNWKYDLNKIDGYDQYYEILEITKAKDLVREGMEQHHCVASYKDKCMRGQSSIFSMRYFSEKYLTNKRCLTIEVNIPKKIVVQARGKFNRFPTYIENNIMNKWISYFGLKNLVYSY